MRAPASNGGRQLEPAAHAGTTRPSLKGSANANAHYSGTFECEYEPYGAFSGSTMTHSKIRNHIQRKRR